MTARFGHRTGLALVLFFAASCQRESVPVAAAPSPGLPAPVPQESASGSQTPFKKRALLIGINDYKHDDFKDLRGCLRDVDNMRDVLVNHYDFDPSSVVTLRDREATLHAITTQFEQHLIGPATDDTVAVFYFSGHGSQMVDTDGDEPDGWDETLVTHDSGRIAAHENRDLSDDQLNRLLARLNQKTKHVTVVLDSCHSGTAVRAAGEPRSAPRDERGVPAATRGTSEGSGGMRASSADYTLISGARTDEYSFEREIGGKPAGAMTWFLADALRKAGPRASYRDVMDVVKAEVTAVYPAQHPQLEGSGQDSLAFGTTHSEPKSFVAVSGTTDGLVLAAGRAHGVTPGSVYAVFPAEEHDFAREHEILRGKVASVDDLTSKLTPTTIALHGLPARGRAVEVEHHYQIAPLRVLFHDLKSDLIAGIRSRLLAYPVVREAADARDYDLAVRLSEDHGVRIEAGTPDPIAPEIRRDADAIATSVRVVLGWARWQSLRTLSNAATASLPLAVEVDESARSSILFEPGAISARVRAGEPLTVAISNQTSDRWYVYLFNLSGDGSVTLVYPPAGANESIEPHSDWRKALRGCTPAGRKEPLVDTLKVFFTRQPTDFGFLAQAPLRRGVRPAASASRDPFSTLMQTAAGMRGTTVAQTDVRGWAVRQRAVAVAPNDAAPACQ